MSGRGLDHFGEVGVSVDWKLEGGSGRRSHVSKHDILFTSAIQTAQNSAIRTAINMGVFEAIPSSSKSISVAELAQELKFNEHLLNK